ncbi:protocadherin Fat 1-like [Physella acuta]|uniref:protocadherin Fat 1-like n=1 Tax=Physella acuta TaxID=109671 RepID=UPI0027DAC63C|nr:protocadherin Fat 1-like [Physella acuta]
MVSSKHIRSSTVVSDGTNTASVTLTLTVTNINDNTPVITVIDVDITIDEEKPSGTSAGFVFSASDADAGTALVYTLTETYTVVSLTSCTDATNFNIDSTNGAITLNTKIDVDPATANVVYHPVLHVSDGTNTASVTLTLTVTNINDNTPVITATDVDNTIDEEKPSGTSVGFVFSASDADAGTALVYTLTGIGSNKFIIDRQTGDITLNAKIDVDPGSANIVYNPVLHVSDGINSATVTLTLTVFDINDNAPYCTPMVVYKSLQEGATSTGLYTLTCSDRDAGANSNLTYSIQLGDTSKFSVDISGKIKVDNAVDYETVTSETLEIKVSDSPTDTSLIRSTTVTVIVSITPVNDNTPQWATWSPALTSNTYHVSENDTVGKTLFIMAATDADKDVGGTLTYSIKISSDPSKFAMDSTTGAVTLKSGLDRENGVVSYTLELAVTDGTTALSATVTLSVDGYNDNVPVFSSTPFSIKLIGEAAAKTGSVCTTVAATDADIDPSSTLTFSVDGVSPGSGKFCPLDRPILNITL